jgi:hnRNP-L/PTB/hephaestus splicing factor
MPPPPPFSPFDPSGGSGGYGGGPTGPGGWGPPSTPDGYGFPPPPQSSPWSSGPLGSGTGGGGLISNDRSDGSGSVLLVINLPEGKINPDMLFTLFGVYGDVLRVKILYNKKDTALIQFATPQQASLARQHLDKIELIDKKISVVISKNKEVQPPPVVAKFQNDTTRDYTDSPFHRFSRPGNRNERHVCAPSQSLHISNLPDYVTVDDLKLLFTSNSEAGEENKVIGVKLFGDKKRMAFVTFSTVTDAINALMRYHNQKYGDKHIKITFSHARESTGGLY